MAQRLRALAGFAEDLILGTRLHVVAYNPLKLQVWEIQGTLLASLGTRHICGTHTYTQAGKTFMHIK